MAKNKTFLPKRINWFRLPDYIKNIFEAPVNNSATNLLALDSEGNSAIVEVSSLSGGSSILASGTTITSPVNISGDFVTIPHGLVTTPSKEQVILSLGTLEPIILTLSSVDATNIIVGNFDGWNPGTDIIWKVIQ